MSYTKSGNSWVLAVVVVFERSWERSTAQNNLHISRSRCRISRRSVRPPTRPHSPLSIVACTVWHARCQNGPAGTITTPSPSCLRPPPQGYWDGPSGQISRPARPQPVPGPMAVPSRPRPRPSNPAPPQGMSAPTAPATAHRGHAFHSNVRR